MQDTSAIGEARSFDDGCSEFRGALRRWLAANLPDGWQTAKSEPIQLAGRFAFRHAWHRRLYRGGWLGLQWPRKYGGRGLSLSHQIIFNEECARFEAPVIANWVGLELIGPTLLAWGSDYQKEKFLPRVLNGDDIWCQGWSETGAGSDLAALTTTASPSKGCFVIDGHKRWCSWAAFASHCMVLARTGPIDQRHKSLTCFVVPLDSPGVLVRAIKMANEEAEENDMVLQSVRVPVENMVGPLNGGWRVALTAMEHARAAAVSMRSVEVGSCVSRLLRLARRQASSGPLDPRMRERLLRVTVRAEALRDHAHRRTRGGPSEGVSSACAVEKLLWSSVVNEMAELALHIEGAPGLVSDRALEERWPGEWAQCYFRAKGTAIEGGTSEIHRDVIARRVLRAVCQVHG